MQEKIILLGAGGQHNFDVKVQRWNYILLGFLFIFQGVIYIFDSLHGIFSDTMIVVMFIAGVAAILFAIINFSRSSRFSPKVIINDEKVVFKTSLFKDPDEFAWKKLKRIEFKPYQIDFIDMAGHYETIFYDCTAEISIKIKTAIREMAESKGIDVTGG